MSVSLYDILGVSKSNSCNDIKKAYHILARTHHPDKGGNPEKFKEIVRASEILTDEKKRKHYDDYGMENESMSTSFPFEVNINDLFGNMFQSGNMFQTGTRKGKKPPPTIQTVHISLEQFYMGHNFDIHINRQKVCSSCDHGAKSKEQCRSCNGSGIVSKIVQLGPMTMQTAGPCMDCQGKGCRTLQKCDICAGTGNIQEQRALSVKIVPGTRPHETYIFSEVCSDHPSYETPGDAHITIIEDPNDKAFICFKRSGDKLQHLETTISISLAESLIGCNLKIEGHPGYEELFVKIPSGSFHDTRYCLSGFGMPTSIGMYGDLFIRINVTISPAERSLFVTKGCELLTPLFEDKIRKCNTEETVHDNLYIK